MVKHKKIRRGGRNKKSVNIVKTCDLWFIYYINVNNLDARKCSLESIISSNSYSVATINETHYQGSKKVNVPGYLTYSKNRTDKNAGGIATAVIDTDAAYCVKVDEGHGRN